MCICLLGILLKPELIQKFTSREDMMHSLPWSEFQNQQSIYSRSEY